MIPDDPSLAAFLQQVGSQAQGYANTAYANYDSNFQPAENSISSAAGQDLSPGYQTQVAGMASSGAAQAGEAQRTNSLKDLQAFGIDPSSGRYAELDSAERGRTAATQAGAANDAVLQTRAAGLGLQQQVANSAIQSAQVGNQALQTAASIKYPPMYNPAVNTNITNPSLAANNAMAANDQAINAANLASMQATNTAAINKGLSSSVPYTMPTVAGTGGGSPAPVTGSYSSGLSRLPPSSPNSSSASAPANSGSGYGTVDNSVWDPSMVGANPGPTNPFSDPSNSVIGPGSTNPTDTSIYSGGATDPYAGLYGGYSTGDTYTPGATNTGGVFDPSYDGSAPSGDAGSGWGDSAGDPTNSYTGFAQGGAVGGAINLQQGGIAPPSASPSNGQQTDDIHANVNANEFVVPKDVALWKGQEFFQKLIATARKARLSAPAQGSPPSGQTQPAMG
jgi:hypothetical protein